MSRAPLLFRRSETGSANFPGRTTVTDLVVRALTQGEEHLFTGYAQPDVVGFAIFGRDYPD